jgi:APA family basic amino acid/polyamine antiporter
VCVGVLVLRRTDPDRVRPFRVRGLPFVAIMGAAACVYVMLGLPPHAWVRFLIWLAVGFVLYFGYGYRHSRLKNTGVSTEAGRHI